MRGETARVGVESMVSGGRAKAVLPDGRVVFVAGAAPGDEVELRLTKSKKRFAEAEVVEVVEAGPDRQEPPCSAVAAGCGGCDWQHLTPDSQVDAKRSIVVDALERLARVTSPPVEPTVALPMENYRTTVRAVVDPSGRAGFRARASHDPVVPDRCLVAHPAVAELLAEGRFVASTEVKVRVSIATGQRIVVVDGPSDRVDLGAVAAAGDLAVVSAAELAGGRRAWLFEDVAGLRWRVSAESFFQPGPAGAEALVKLVSEAAGGDRRWARVLDGYCGIGLFGGSVACDSLIGVERSASALADARVNLAEHAAGAEVQLVPRDMAGWEPVPIDLAIVDPPRAGMSPEALARLMAGEPERIVMVSCDPATAARDTGLLIEQYNLDRVVPVDQFGHTSHVETVSTFLRR